MREAVIPGRIYKKDIEVVNQKNKRQSKLRNRREVTNFDWTT